MPNIENDAREFCSTAQIERDMRRMKVEAQRERVETVCDNGENLSDWEVEFLDSVLSRLDKGRPLAGKQESALEDIEEKGDYAVY